MKPLPAALRIDRALAISRLPPAILLAACCATATAGAQELAGSWSEAGAAPVSASPESIPLTPEPTGVAENQPSQGMGPAERIVMSLSVVLGVFFLVAWMQRKRHGVSRSPATGELPAEAVASLGEVALGTDDTAQLLRVGAKLLLVGRSSQGWSTLTEVTDPVEVERLTRICHYGGDGRRQGDAA